MSAPVILILAAGHSSRMGGMRDKLLELIGNEPLLQVMVERALGASKQVFVCLPDAAHPRVACLGNARPIWVPEADEGMAASIRTGISALPEGAGDVMILPADMPELTSEDLAAVWRAHQPGAITRGASADGVPGHPVIFPQDLLRELFELRGDAGAKSVIVRHRQRVHLVPLPDQHALVDLDTPEAWAAWRASQTQD